jgi:HAD superfamily hydrolase (TIGR01509 family)
MAEVPHIEVDRLADEWQWALDAAVDAVADSDRSYSLSERRRLGRALRRERAETSALLAELAKEQHVPGAPWIATGHVTPAELGLRPGTRACVLDLDGVLTNSGSVHAAAWAEVFDDLLLRLDRPYVPFDTERDYAAYLDGRPRLDGIHHFLRSRGIRLPEGSPGDAADAETAHGLARHKADALARLMRRRGVAALPGARRYLEAAGHAHVRRAVVSGSVTVLPMLRRAGLESLIDAIVDATDIQEQALRVRPAPDVVLAACRALDVDPRAAVAFVHTPDGVAAAGAAGLGVVAVAADEPTRERLLGFGAERAVPGLAALLAPRLRTDALR